MSNLFTPLQELRALATFINDSIDEIEQVCSKTGKEFPSLHDPSGLEQEEIFAVPEVAKASNILVSAASQLVAAVRPPTVTFFCQASLFHIPSALGVAIKAHVPEILREAGPQGLRVKDIAAFTGINSDKLAHILGLLASNYIFREIIPDTFTNNRLSAGLDTGKNVKDIIADPGSKYDGTGSRTALWECMTTDGLRSSGHFADVIFDPQLTNSGEPNHTAFNLAYKTDLPYFGWLSKPEHAYESKRFAVAMHSISALTAPRVITKGFDWKSLPKGSVVVDVAGGIGSHTMILAKEFNHLRYIVQDRAAVMHQEAPRFWNQELPEAISSGRVQLQGQNTHDMFGPQPIHNAAAFFLRAIIHDWSDDYSIKILSQLRAAATPDTRLIVIDSVIPYACGDHDLSSNIEGAKNVRPSAPAPLLPNYGVANLMTYLMDMHMTACLNGQERTVPHFARIFERSGWKLVRVHTEGHNFHDIKMIGVPAEA
ncbi:S-adenosyl-L-methionine-dependent methyltransferase [Irpex rosettiformis]|uniref:S-adenosyl-L-methionine-dependent methyltransferase n=1 Tax=Irpex rosettiformis TaxID=378272 RepID=A0ACB8U3X3_9APHY|nr:S-adenosyl-L-methionine-dependent methyltransferase [Irpex rosettiformis]